MQFSSGIVVPFARCFVCFKRNIAFRDQILPISINSPTDLRMCVAVPKIDVPKKKTKVSRGVIPKKVKLTDAVLNLSNASAIVAGFIKKDPELIGNSIKDVIVEPARQHVHLSPQTNFADKLTAYIAYGVHFCTRRLNFDGDHGLGG